MYYKSTRGQTEKVSFQEVLFSGLAPDGGLYIPEYLPGPEIFNVKSFRNKEYDEIAQIVLKPFIGNYFDDDQLREITKKAYSKFKSKNRCELVKLSNYHMMLELFHGPTYAFKDFAMQMIAQMFQEALNKIKKTINIIVATSGDTGAAAVNAFSNLKNINLFVLYPNNRISEIQRRQMTTAIASNVKIFSVDGTFDDCQFLVKKIFSDTNFSINNSLTGVNSINWARIISQVVYYCYAASKIDPQKKVDFCIPTGNFGNIYAGFIAKKMGTNIDKLIIATNLNDILHRTFLTGRYLKDKVYRTHSPSMDIQVSSNFERLLYHIYEDPKIVIKQMEQLNSEGFYEIECSDLNKLKEDFLSGVATEEETLIEISSVYKKLDLAICPHTAVGTFVSRKFLNKSKVMITLATAHPSKFIDSVQSAVGKAIAQPTEMKQLYSKTERVIFAPNEVNFYKEYINKES